MEEDDDVGVGDCSRCLAELLIFVSHRTLSPHETLEEGRRGKGVVDLVGVSRRG